MTKHEKAVEALARELYYASPRKWSFNQAEGDARQGFRAAAEFVLKHRAPLTPAGRRVLAAAKRWRKLIGDETETMCSEYRTLAQAVDRLSAEKRSPR